VSYGQSCRVTPFAEGSKSCATTTSPLNSGVRFKRGTAAMYHGEVEVEDDDFYMKFDKFILRDTEIAFEVSGTDEENFKTDGVARQIGTGEYRADVTVEYPTYFVNQRYQGR